MKFLNLKKEGHSGLETTSFGVLLAFLFLLPLVISPSGVLTFAFTKVSLTVLAVVVTFALFILMTLKRGSVTFPRSLGVLTFLAVPVITLISAFFSGSMNMSLTGYGIELDTFLSVLILFALMFLVMQLFNSANKIFFAYVAFALAMLILFVFHGLRFLIGPEFLSFDIFTLSTSNTFGKWNDLAVLSGLGVILSTLLLEMTRVAHRMKIAAYLVFILGLIYLAIVNFFLVWIILGVFSLISFVYLFSFGGGEDGKERKVPVLSVVVLAASALFVIAGQQVSTTITSILNINVVDVRPLWSSTIEVAQGTYSGVVNTLLGSGPNTFLYQWSLFKPDAVNETLLWNTDFNFGISYLATTLVTVGVLGALAWLAFLVFFVYQGFSTLFSAEAKNSFIKYLQLSSFISSVFLWLILLFYVPGIVVTVLAFFFTGLFFATVSVSGVLPQKEISFTKTPKIGFIITLLLVFVLIATVSLGYLSFQKTLSSVYYQRGLRALNLQGDVIAAGQNISRAISLADHDIYYRTLVDLNLFQLNQILNTEDLSSNAAVGRAQQALGLAVANAQAAVDANPVNYQNYSVLAGVYAAVAPLNVEGAVQGAQGAYENAIQYAPKNPALPLAIARLEASQGNLDGARQNINQALQIKSNYTEAIFTLAQIEVSAGNVDEAIASVEVATLIEPNNPTLYFQLGLLYYNKDDYSNAATAFETAISLVPDYANAKYFLGLSYYELNRTSDAISEFLDLQATNPENEEVNFILGNLQAGLSPFNEVVEPLDDEPESREELPLEEEEL